MKAGNFVNCKAVDLLCGKPGNLLTQTRDNLRACL